jgi:hypothetical protein
VSVIYPASRDAAAGSVLRGFSVGRRWFTAVSLAASASPAAIPGHHVSAVIRKQITGCVQKGQAPIRYGPRPRIGIDH